MTEALRPPVARYRLELSITGNTIEELVDELSVRANDFGYETMRGRAVCDETGGRHHLQVT